MQIFAVLIIAAAATFSQFEENERVQTNDGKTGTVIEVFESAADASVSVTVQFDDGSREVFTDLLGDPTSNLDQLRPAE